MRIIITNTDDDLNYDDINYDENDDDINYDNDKTWGSLWAYGVQANRDHAPPLLNPRVPDNNDNDHHCHANNGLHDNNHLDHNS